MKNKLYLFLILKIFFFNACVDIDLLLKHKNGTNSDYRRLMMKERFRFYSASSEPIKICSNNKLIAIKNSSGISIWNLKTKKNIQNIKMKSYDLASFEFSKDKKEIITLYKKKKEIWNIKKGIKVSSKKINTRKISIKSHLFDHIDNKMEPDNHIYYNRNKDRVVTMVEKN